MVTMSETSNPLCTSTYGGLFCAKFGFNPFSRFWGDVRTRRRAEERRILKQVKPICSPTSLGEHNKYCGNQVLEIIVCSLVMAQNQLQMTSAPYKMIRNEMSKNTFSTKYEVLKNRGIYTFVLTSFKIFIWYSHYKKTKVTSIFIANLFLHKFLKII